MKQYKIVYSIAATNDLLSISDYIIEKYEDTFNAKKVTDKINRKCRSLSIFPRASSPIGRIANKEIYFAHAGKFTAIYYINDKRATVEILRIVYSRMNLDAIIDTLA